MLLGVHRWSPILALLTFTLPAAAQDDFESFRVELTASAWLVTPSGTIQSGITPVDLRRDLQLDSSQPHFFGKLVVKPARRHRIMIEGIPYRLNGAATISRQIVFAGRTYNLQDFVTSKADIDYIAGAYQFDIVSRPQGHFGLLAGVGFVNATGTLTSRNFGFNGVEHQSFPFPQVGAEGRAFLLPHRTLLEVDGELKGMSLASYGHYLQFAVKGGVSVGHRLTIQAGFMRATADVHRQDNTRGFQPTFNGPIFGIQLRDR
jgi:hypothetical protein